jgi:hypothetical protein
VQEIGTRLHKAIVRMLRTASNPLATDPQLVAIMLQGSMSGVIRILLESSTPEKQLEALREELILVACAYLDACSTRALVQRPDAVGGARIPAT